MRLPDGWQTALVVSPWAKHPMRKIQIDCIIIMCYYALILYFAQFCFFLNFEEALCFCPNGSCVTFISNCLQLKQKKNKDPLWTDDADEEAPALHWPSGSQLLHIWDQLVYFRSFNLFYGKTGSTLRKLKHIFVEFSNCLKPDLIWSWI